MHCSHLPESVPCTMRSASSVGDSHGVRFAPRGILLDPSIAVASSTTCSWHTLYSVLLCLTRSITQPEPDVLSSDTQPTSESTPTHGGSRRGRGGRSRIVLLLTRTDILSLMVRTLYTGSLFECSLNPKVKRQFTARDLHSHQRRRC